MKRSIITLCSALVIFITMAALAACGNGNGVNGENGESPGNTPHAPPAYDREGFPLVLPEEINAIISIGPSNTEILMALGFGAQIIYTDRFSNDVPGIRPEIAVLEMMALDAEFILNAQPDVIFITGMTRAHGDDHPLRLVSDAGISVIYMPSSTSIAAIIEDIRFIAAVMGAHGGGEAIVADMQAEIDSIRQITENIADDERRTVYFEISPAPFMFSFGSGTFLHEMIELVGGINIFADREGWLPVADEVLLPLNPDVILTSTNFLEDPIAEIADRPGWSVMTAVQNGDIFQIDTASSNRPSHNIIRALREMAQAVHPDLFS